MSFISFNARPLSTREEIARQVHAVSLRRGLDELATVIALMTIATEVGAKGQWWCPWNAKDSTSKNYPHDSQADDGRSVGYFQQQNGRAGETVTGEDNWWGPMRSRMTLEQAADVFLDRLAADYGRARNNRALAGKFAQRVQGSAFPDRYAEHWDEAWEVLRRALSEQAAEQALSEQAEALATPTLGVEMGFTGDPVWLEDVLREALGNRLVVEGNWKGRGNGGTMGDIWGVMIHHTGNIRETVKNIRDGVQQPGGFLPGPLAQCLITPDGKCHLIAVGPCNHAGRGSYAGISPNTGNRRLIGFECAWPTLRGDLPGGFDPNELWSTPQVITMRDATAAVLKKLGVGSGRVIGHKEYSSEGKPDPGNMDMNWFRSEVQKDLDGIVFPGELFAPELGPLVEAQVSLAAEAAGIEGVEPVATGHLCDQLTYFAERVDSGSAAAALPDADDRLAELERIVSELRYEVEALSAARAGATNGAISAGR